MPIYSYTCLNCEDNREELQSFGTAAPICCGQPMFRGFSNIVQVNMGKMTPTLRKLGGVSSPFTKGDKTEQYVRDKRAAVDYDSSKRGV